MLKKDNIHSQFLHYVIPSLISFSLSGVYCIVDGYFIGNRIGDIGLAGINIAFPITAFVQSLGTGIGMGGAIYYSIHKARHEDDTKNKYFYTTLLLLLVCSFIFTAFLIGLIDPLLKNCGCTETLLPYAKEYATIILIGTTFQLFGTGTVPFIRNMGSTSFAMISMLSGFFTNIVLDYVTIWLMDWGLAGAAISSVVGQLITFLVCVIAIYLNKEREQLYFTGFDLNCIKKLILVGLSPFGLTFIPNLSLLFINRQAAIFGGDQAVAVYSVVAYAITVVYLMIQGVSDGCQPLCSHYFGKQDKVKCLKVQRLSFLYSFIFSFIGVVCLTYGAVEISNLFGASDSTCLAVKECMPLFAIGCFFVAVSRTIISFFYACTVNLYASVCIYGEAIIMIVFLMILPSCGSLGLTGVWLATPVTQLIVMIIGILLLKFGKNSIDLFY